jgi:hypothetical protein
MCMWKVDSLLERDVGEWAMNAKQAQLKSKSKVPGYKYTLSDNKQVPAICALPVGVRD